MSEPFWEIYDKTKENGDFIKEVVNIDWVLYMEWLSSEGFRIMHFGPDNSMFIKISDNIITETDITRISTYVLNYLKESMELKVYQYMMNNQSKYLSKKTLSMMREIDYDLSIFQRDTEKVVYLFYKNCFVEITKTTVEVKNYNMLTGYIWDKQKLHRNFYNDSAGTSQFETFINKICGRNKHHMEQLMGYLIHTYKQRSNAKCVVLYDKESEDGFSQGGTGKSLVGKAMGHIRQNREQNGKDFDPTSKFKYQCVDFSDQIIFLNDIDQKKFDLEVLFNDITDNLSVEAKGGKPIPLEFKYSPKFIITTNGLVKGFGSSYRRRMFEMEINDHYDEKFTPRDEFKRDLFDDWNNSDWGMFDSYMVQVIQRYLCTGVEIYTSETLEQKKIENEMGLEMWSWAENDVQTNTVYHSRDLLETFRASPDAIDVKHLQNLSQRKFNSRIKMYCVYKKYEIETRKSNGNVFLTFVEKEECPDWGEKEMEE